MSILLNSPPGVCGSSIKRRTSSDEEDEVSSKRPRNCYYVTLESESPVPTDEDDESIYTVQGYETEFVQDTSDTSSHSYDSDDDISVQLEFEVASQSEEENPMLNPTSSSDPEDYVTMGVIAALYNEADIGFADDSDDSRSTVDSEIGRADYWTCVQCLSKNNNPLFRYCEKCYQIRKNFFPPRPKRKKRRQQKANTTSDSAEKKCEEIMSHDSGISSQDSKSLSQDLDENLECTKADVDVVDGIVSSRSEIKQEENTSSVECSESKDVNVTTETESKKVENDPEDKMCVMCTLNPKNGAFSHGSTLHVCCCYKCAVRIWRTNKHCPICNRKITNVQKVFYN